MPLADQLRICWDHAKISLILPQPCCRWKAERRQPLLKLTFAIRRPAGRAQWPGSGACAALRRQKASSYFVDVRDWKFGAGAHRIRIGTTPQP